jgi:hypothetical protein
VRVGRCMRKEIGRLLNSAAFRGCREWGAFACAPNGFLFDRHVTSLYDLIVRHLRYIIGRCPGYLEAIWRGQVAQELLF